MAALTGQEIISQLAIRLRSRFSNNEFVEIYKDKPVQSMKTPCIFIHSVETAHTPELRRYARWDHIIDIRCHPGKMRTDIQTWACGLGPVILNTAETITVADQTVKVNGATWRVEDDVLHVIVKYSYRVMHQPEVIPDMQTLSYGKRIKE